jgi:hypothetical protein
MTASFRTRTGFSGETKKNPFSDIKGAQPDLDRKQIQRYHHGSHWAAAQDQFVKFPDDNKWYLPAMVWKDPEDRRKVYYIDEGLWDLEYLKGALQAVILAPWMTEEGKFGCGQIATTGLGG